MNRILNAIYETFCWLVIVVVLLTIHLYERTKRWLLAKKH